MSRIKILPEILANKIAAGEVVERPASVVKELLENAIDAQSTRVMIEIENGGRSLIRVSDNGLGMNHDDALLSLERYATSKIYDDDDLFAIRTLGFRGEALPSISSVSRFSLISRDRRSDSGVQIHVDGGKITRVTEIGAPVGTMIAVKQLFYNTPARRKFLKSTTTEMGHISETVASIALGWPSIQFRLQHNQKAVRNWPPATDPLDRVSAVLGKDLRPELHPLEQEEYGVHISGWVSTPALTRSTSQKIYLYVNGRYIRDRGLQHALFEGYRGRLMKGRFPVAVLFVNVPHDQLDVNVHPTKHEVRFSGYKKVYEALKMAVLKTWDRTGSSGSSVAVYQPPQPQQQVSSRSGTWRAPVARQRMTETSAEALPREKPNCKAPTQSSAFHSEPAREQAERTVATAEEQAKYSGIAEEGLGFQQQLWTEKKTARFRVIGQIHNTYVVCESVNGLVLIDQHAAHERIYYEQLKQRSAGKPVQSQKLLVPETLDLGYREAAVLLKMVPQLVPFGLEIEPFGGNTFIVKSVPAMLADREIRPLVQEIVDKVMDIGFSEGLGKAIDECLVLMACHGTVRAHQRLSEREMTQLITQLERCENSEHCPHGRPITVQYTLQTLEKAFKRIP